MSIPLLIEVYDEMRRLAIAGSAVAPGDFRLKKLVSPLQKAGEKAPVFGKVAVAAQAVVESNEKTAATALLELTTLVNAILYTQGETGATGDLTPIETTNLGDPTTQVGARTLKPLMEALHSTGSGRLELVKDAFERGAFKDLRLVKSALHAIDDPYPELGEFMCQKVLPLYGKAIVPELRSKLDIKGGSGAVNRLQLLQVLDPEGSRDLIQSALNEGSKEIKVAAIECLGASESDLVYLLEQVKAKARDVRAAALRALAGLGVKTADVLGTLKKAIAGNDLELMISRIKETKLPEIRDYVLQQAQSQFDELLKTKDKKAQGPMVQRLQHLIMCLENGNDSQAEAFLLKCFETAAAFSAVKSEPSGADLNELVANVLANGTPKMKKQLVRSHETLASRMFPPAVFAARTVMSPADFFTDFSPWLKGFSQKRTKKNSAGHDRAMAVIEVLTAGDEQRMFHYRSWMSSVAWMERSAPNPPLPALDPRWLDAAVEAEAVELVCELARPGHTATNKLLSEQLAEAKNAQESQEILRTMIRIQHPDAVESLIKSLKQRAKDAHHSYMGYWYGPMITDLPKSALPKIEELLPTLPEKMVDQLMESVLALKDKPE